MAWTVVYHHAAAEELADQPEDIRAKLDFIVQLVATFGLERIPGTYARHLQERLWEFRLKGKDGIVRALYVTAHGQRILVVRICLFRFFLLDRACTNTFVSFLVFVF